MKTVVDRIQWTVNILEVAPTDLILEIGCGNGSAVSMISRSLKEGMITAIDQSEKMVKIAKNKNAEHESVGKVKFLAANFQEAELGQSHFNKIFAVNVNLFWMNPEHELKIIRDRLLPNGTLYLVNQPPNIDKIRLIEERTCHNLKNAGFQIKQVLVGDQRPVPGICIIAYLEP